MGGEIGVLALATPGSPIGMGTGGGDVTIAGDVDASGGDGTEEGGNAGFIRLVSQVTGSVEVVRRETYDQFWGFVFRAA